MDWLLIATVVSFALFGVVCLLLVALSMPGTWIMLAVAIVLEVIFVFATDRGVLFGWTALVISLALALVGEALEFAAGALGAKYGGGTKRGMIGAIIGGIVGGIGFTIILPFIPLVGTLLGAIVGTFAGAVIAEVSGAAPMSVRGSMRPAIGATIGRVLGTVGKVGIALVIWMMLIVAAIWPA